MPEMSAISIVMPGGLTSTAVRSAAILNEPLRRLPQMPRTVIPLASLIGFSRRTLPPKIPCDPLSHLQISGKPLPPFRLVPLHGWLYTSPSPAQRGPTLGRNGDDLH